VAASATRTAADDRRRKGMAVLLERAKVRRPLDAVEGEKVG
jgi:hypothetical protein